MELKFKGYIEAESLAQDELAKLTALVGEVKGEYEFTIVGEVSKGQSPTLEDPGYPPGSSIYDGESVINGKKVFLSEFLSEEEIENKFSDGLWEEAYRRDEAIEAHEADYEYDPDDRVFAYPDSEE